ncbi:MAG: hypothetical protein M1820_008279 [Bogoriella megaspora]|nr:MAG: hypothetical protein M1820_008279 [Bogoriella megaspora]
MPQEKAVLLSLPTEIRTKILYYALLPPGNEYLKENCKTILCRTPPTFRAGAGHDVFLRHVHSGAPEASNSAYFHWFTPRMSGIFLICRQLCHEARFVLYTRFSFSFNILSLCSFEEIGNRRVKLGLLRSIEICYSCYWYSSNCRLFPEDKLKWQVDLFIYGRPYYRDLRALMPALRSVTTVFVWRGSEYDPTVQERDVVPLNELLVDLLTWLIEVWRGVDVLQVKGGWYDKLYEEGIANPEFVRECNRRIAADEWLDDARAGYFEKLRREVQSKRGYLEKFHRNEPIADDALTDEEND